MIPQEAIEAAHAAICEESLADHLDPDWKGRCVKALEAAVPFIRADAKGEALEEAAAELPFMSRPITRLVRHKEVASWLHARAAAVRGEG